MPLFLGKDKITRVIMSVESADGGTNTNDATLSSGAQMLQGVTAYSKGTKYTGTIATVEGPTPDISVSSDGLIAASVSNPKGYQAESMIKTTTQQLTTKGATTITPSSVSQTAVNSGVYTTGKIIVSAVPTETKTITANGTYSPSAGKYFSSVEVTIAGDTPTYQSKTISPSTSVQTVTADSGYDALSDVTVNAIQTETKSVTSNGTYKPTNGKYFSSVTVNVPSETFNTQTKTVTPTESTQTVSPDNGYNGLSTVTVNPISSTYIGSAVPTKGSTTITPSTSAQIAVSAGTYVTGNITVAAIPNNYVDTSDATAAASDIIQNKTAYIKGKKVTGTMPSKGAATITPTTTNQTINAGQYLSGAQTIKGDGNLVPENIISGKSIFGVSGSVVIQKYYTGTSDPSSSLGNDGDIYLKA